MCLAKSVSAVSFAGTLAVGLAAAWVVSILGFTGGWSNVDSVQAVNEKPVRVFNSCHRRINLAPIRAQDMGGSWTGSWGYDGSPSTIEIHRATGDRFYGTLKKDGAEIALEGSFDSDGRSVAFQETKVIKLGSEMSMWSLGENSGYFTPDGRTMFGSGHDQWGTYRWEMTRTRN